MTKFWRQDYDPCRLEGWFGVRYSSWPMVELEAVDTFYLERALQLAADRLGYTSPNPVVGAVVVREGKIVGEGTHQKAGAPHAEVLALEQAQSKAAGSTLYVTLEPCCHHGRTPPCVRRIIEAGVARVVVGMIDPDPRVCGGGIKELRKAGIEVVLAGGDSRERCAEVNRFFLKWIRTGRPFVSLKYAMTLDGKIATRRGDSRWISGEESRNWVHRQRSIHDAVMVGIGTVLADDPRLTVRVQQRRDPMPVVVDSKARLPLESQLMEQGRPLVVAVAENAPPGRVKRLKEAGVTVIECGENSVALDKLLHELGTRGVLSVLAEGGGNLNASLLELGLVDYLAVFIAPKLIGGRSALTPVEGGGVDSISEAQELRRVSWRAVGRDVLLEGYLGKIPTDWLDEVSRDGVSV